MQLYNTFEDPYETMQSEERKRKRSYDREQQQEEKMTSSSTSKQEGRIPKRRLSRFM